MTAKNSRSLFLITCTVQKVIHISAILHEMYRKTRYYMNYLRSISLSSRLYVLYIENRFPLGQPAVTVCRVRWWTDTRTLWSACCWWTASCTRARRTGRPSAGSRSLGTTPGSTRDTRAASSAWSSRTAFVSVLAEADVWVIPTLEGGYFNVEAKGDALYNVNCSLRCGKHCTTLR